MKKKATKLFAVVAMVASPAIVTAQPRDPWSAQSSIDPDRVRVSLTALEGTIARDTAPRQVAVDTARPRQMPSGAPACGNVASRAPRPIECSTSESSSEPILATTPSTIRPAARPNTTPTRTATRTRVAGDNP